MQLLPPLQVTPGPPVLASAVSVIRVFIRCLPESPVWSWLALPHPRVIGVGVIPDDLPAAAGDRGQLVGVAVVVLVGDGLAGQDGTGLDVGVERTSGVDAGGNV